MTEHPIPLDALDTDIAIVGKKGGGKTFTAKGLVERLLDLGRRVLILDPLGVWAGLRTSADGEGDGYKVAIIGGEHADLPLDPAAAEPLARIIAAENLPTVIDLSDLSKTKQQAFLLVFLHELRRVNSEALTVVLEEADVFAPQQPMGDDSKALHGEIDWIARRGRFRGFRLVTVTQRPARISKDVLTQCATLIAHRLPAPQDRDAVKAWVEGNGDREKARQVFDTLAGLKVGEAWMWASEQDRLERVRFPPIRTLDTSATPKAGEKRITPKTLAEVDVSPIRAAMEAVREEEAKPKAAKASEAEIRAAEQRGHDRGEQAARATIHELEARIAELERIIASVRETVGAQERPVEAPRPRPAPVAGNGHDKPAPALAPPPGGLSPAEERVLGAIVSVYPRGLTYAAATARAGVSKRSSQYRRYRKNLLAAELVEERDGRLYAAGDALAMVLPEPAGLDGWCARLPPSQANMLRAIASGHGLGKEEVAERAGVSPTSSGLGAGLRELADLALIEQREGRYYPAEGLT